VELLYPIRGLLRVPRRLPLSVTNQLSTEADFVPGTAWHLYRIELRRNSLKVSIDVASPLIERFDPNLDYHMPVGHVGLWSRNVQLNVSSFRIVSL
jgi:hypothetical protein